MSIAYAYSTQPSADEAVKEIFGHFKAVSPKMVIWFASSSYDQGKLSAGFEAAFGSAQVLGCSTAGEIVSGRMMKNSVVAMALDRNMVEDVTLAVVDGLSQGAGVSKAFAEFERRTGQPMSGLDFTQYVGLILVDGLRGAEERLMDQIGDLTNVTFIGGSAGDDLGFKQTFVSANGQTCTDAAVLALLKVKNGFDIIKTQSFKVLPQSLTVTKALEANREVVEFDHQPAAKAYAEAVGCAPSDAGAHFMRHPVGLMVDGEPYVRSPQQFKGDHMVFYCNILDGMELSLLESLDIVEDTKKAVAAKQGEIGKISGLINFHCILRTLELEQKNQTEAYGKLFTDIPTIGFSTYGEEYLGHVNQTSTMLVFK